jgi:hypothetical protein
MGVFFLTHVPAAFITKRLCNQRDTCTFPKPFTAQTCSQLTRKVSTLGTHRQKLNGTSWKKLRGGSHDMSRDQVLLGFVGSVSTRCQCLSNYVLMVILARTFGSTTRGV